MVLPRNDGRDCSSSSESPDRGETVLYKYKEKTQLEAPKSFFTAKCLGAAFALK